MTRKDFDASFSRFQLSEILSHQPSIRKVSKILQTFKCSKNKDLEEFLHKKAITFEKFLRSRTFVYINNDLKKVSAYFTISISTLYTDGISKEVIQTLDGYRNDAKSIPCFLIGQLGKSDTLRRQKVGTYILDDAVSVINELHHLIGGRFILLDAVNNKDVIEFYKNNLFFPIEETDNENIKMIRPYYE